MGKRIAVLLAVLVLALVSGLPPDGPAAQGVTECSLARDYLVAPQPPGQAAMAWLDAHGWLGNEDAYAARRERWTSYSPDEQSERVTWALDHADAIITAAVGEGAVNAEHNLLDERVISMTQAALLGAIATHNPSSLRGNGALMSDAAGLYIMGRYLEDGAASTTARDAQLYLRQCDNLARNAPR